MAYTFTEAERAELNALYDAGPTASGNFAAFYARMSEMLQERKPDGTVPENDQAVQNVRL